MSFFNKFKGSGTGTSAAAAKESASKKKDEPPPEPTPLEKMLSTAGPLRNDGTDKFFGLENFGNTCYCNSIVQALFYSEVFRHHVINYPPLPDGPNGVRPKVNVTLRPPMSPDAIPAGQKQADAAKRRQSATVAGANPQAVRPEDKPDSPEYKKKQVMMKGPILELSEANSTAYGMDECTFTGLKDIFLTLIESQTRTGVLSPQRFLEIFKRDNEMFRNSMHQDAHEFYGLVLNAVISNVEANAKRMRDQELAALKREASLSQSVEKAVGASNALMSSMPATGWVHDTFEGLLTSETKCLTCETASQRDETFLDLSIDLEEHSSVTSCLGQFSAEEMLCERNKFHCDHCGGLQEAEKRMKIHRMPKVLTFHLKRFKYTEDYSRLQKLFHRVVYPYHLRLFNTTDDAEDPDRLYELYAVVVHIGGNAYHGHYVSVIKTKDRGWLLFDDEMVEPVDKHFVRNFFGDKPGMACAYVLFYQETTFEKMRAEQEAEGFDDLILSNDKAASAVSVQENGLPNGLSNGVADGTPLAKEVTVPPTPTVDDHDVMPPLAHARTAPVSGTVSAALDAARLPQPTPLSHSVTVSPSPVPDVKTKEERKREKKEAEAAKKEAEAAEKARKAAAKIEAEAAEKARKAAAKAEAKLKAGKMRSAQLSEEEAVRKAIEASKAEMKKEKERAEAVEARKEDGADREPAAPRNSTSNFLNRSARGSKSMSKRSFAFLNAGRERADDGEAASAATNGNGHGQGEKFKRQFSFGIGKKKSSNVLS
ncbi:related to carbon catabolite repression protein CREB [Cephalotrichum gorgonifer]|uniref:Ubiquitin carboxyl-terminal hydrolase n=1 Tax=Cephalotrichum gorgonifer TaxID=2041049 RepID=A0AAE8MP06_9PEZI|nr:related to carbon catabolite repression protein CREB [Cephalotrichum gorgonifer]